MQKIDPEAALEKIRKKDPRYDRDAYLFVREALDHTLKMLRKSGSPEPIRDTRSEEESKRHRAHVSGQQLLEGIRSLAVEKFGPMARTVLDHWGVTRCEDFGEIVFNMVDVGLLGKTDKDSRADFAGGFDFAEAFVKPFHPSSRTRTKESHEAGEVEPRADDPAKN